MLKLEFKIVAIVKLSSVRVLKIGLKFSLQAVLYIFSTSIVLFAGLWVFGQSITTLVITLTFLSPANQPVDSSA